MKKRKRDDIFLVRMKRLAIFAFISTTLLTLFLIYESSLSGGASSDHAMLITNAIKSSFNVDDVIKPQSMDFNTEKTDALYYFSGDEVKLSLSVIPSNASKDVTYKFTDKDGNPIEGCSVDENGNFKYTGIEQEHITITACSSYVPSVTASTTVRYRGLSPTDERVAGTDVKFYEFTTGNEYSSSELRVGMKYLIDISLVIKDEYLADPEFSFLGGEKSINAPGLPYKLTLDGKAKDDIYMFDSSAQTITFLKPISGELGLTFKKSASTFFEASSAGTDPNFKGQICAEIYEGFDYMPKGPLELDTESYQDFVTKSEDGEYIITLPADEVYLNLYGKHGDGNTNEMSKLVFRDEESKQTARILSMTEIDRACNGGVCNLYLVSLFDDNIKTKITIIYEGNTPTKLNIYGKKSVTVGTNQNYYFEFDKPIYNEEDVVWSIADGHDKATISESGVLNAKKVGNVTIRATSVYYPDVYQDMTVKIRMWEDFSGAVRKLFGHFTLFSLLGQGVICCYFFLLKKRWLTFILTPLTVFTVSGITEWIQYYMPGRYGMWRDVFLNFAGGIAGMAFVVLCITVYLLILVKVSPGGFMRIKRDLPKITFKEAFTRREPVYICDTQDQEKTAAPPVQFEKNEENLGTPHASSEESKAITCSDEQNEREDIL